MNPKLNKTVSGGYRLNDPLAVFSCAPRRKGMAIQEYIIMRTGLNRDPDVIRIAQRMQPPQRTEVVVGYLHSVWSWATTATADGRVYGLTLESVESLLALPGFLGLMVEVGWLEFIEDSNGSVIIFPEFDRWNGHSAKKRLYKARQKQRERGDKKATNVANKSDKCRSHKRHPVDVDVDVDVDAKKKKSSVATNPPSAEEVHEFAATLDGSAGFSAAEFVDYYAAQGWRQSNGNPLKDWQAACRRWVRKLNEQAKQQNKEIQF